MDMQNLAVGDRIEHWLHGSGIVTFVGTEYLGIAFDDAGDALIRRDSLEKDAPAGMEPQSSARETLPWPASTFIPEGKDAQHYLGSHWDPFVEDSQEIMHRLPDMLSNALLQTGYGQMRTSARSLPEDWPKGVQLAWPLRTQGIGMILHIKDEANSLVSFFPFFATGSQHTLTLREVSVWEGGLEAQITASWSGGDITFFDSQYPINRAWYEVGKDYDFIFSGIAYQAGIAEKREWKCNRHPDMLAWMNERLKEGEEPYETAYTVSMDGAAVLLPISDWDVDDYSFHAPVKSVSEFKDWLGQDGWRVRATVVRFGDENVDLDILITRRAWSDKTPPQIGQDIEGQLWLQGYLWMPK